MEVLDISDLDKEAQKVIEWAVKLAKENQYLKQTIKDLSKLI